MNYELIYTKARDAVDRALRGMWSADACNEAQEATVKQMRQITKSIFAGEEAMPVVQCMNSYKSVHSVTSSVAEMLVAPYWNAVSPAGPKHFGPYEHQYQAWKTLLSEKSPEGKPMSICVTTGTGSGKTECFMLPLVKDLTSDEGLVKQKSVKAIFIYPLNALMEDQKERLEKLLAGTNLTYTVYNGDLPEAMPKPDNNTPEAQRVRQKIDEIRGLVKDSEGNPVKDAEGNLVYRFPKIRYTREMVRKNPPDIVLTNPTMLEYILLRKKDESLIRPELQSLRWIVIDETHTYSGAGAAEMAMLLRRVSLAFNVDPTMVRYATSSATFGNADTPEKKAEAEAKLCTFISGMTGTALDQIHVIDGEREGRIPEGEDRERWKLIFNEEYVALDKLFPLGTVEEKLKALDDMCARLGDSLAMKVKAHYFFRVPNNGLYVLLNEHADGAFKIYTQNLTEQKGEPKIPMLELSRCRTCGEFVAIAKVNMKTGEYDAPMADDSDMFDLEEDDPDASIKTVVFGLTNGAGRRGDNNQPFYIDPTDPAKVVPGPGPSGKWHLVGNTHCSCPYCNHKQTRKKVDEKEDSDIRLDDEATRLMKFRVSPDFISRVIAPPILDELEKYSPAEETDIVLHDGQQYLSFADSRQMAAKATLGQNLQQERMWFYTTIFHELCARRHKKAKVDAEIKSLNRQLSKYIDLDDEDGADRISEKIRKLRKSVKSIISWKEVAALLMKDRYCRVFCEQFLKKSDTTDELDDKGEIPRRVLENYVHSIMVMYLANRPATAPAPETMGLFHPEYPRLKNLELPQAVVDFNSTMSNEANKIDKDDWQNLLRYFIDFSVRPAQAVYLRLSDDNPIDIRSTNRFQAEKPRRRPIEKPKMEQGKVSDSRLVRFLADLYGKDHNIHLNSEAQKLGFNIIKPVIDALWETIALGEDAVLTHGTTWSKEERCHVEDKDAEGTGARRLNLTEMSLKLYDEAWLCDVNSEKGERHTVAMRPVAYSFKGYAPYLHGTEPVKLDENLHEKWEVYPYFPGSGIEINDEILVKWAKEKRPILWNNGIWGEDGIFSDRLRQVYLTPNLFIQAEHTAQVDKSVARRRQQSFKNHGVNILACSTTMEMGVDLGNLEIVMLSSVPPQPANYKQRAGRSGRNNRIKSACVTLCGSDAIGLRTYFSPIEKIINRPVEVPTIDLMSPQVVQRHVNSFLVRAFGVFGHGNINQRVANYYTPFSIVKVDGKTKVKDELSNKLMQPDAKLGNPEGTCYDRFNKCCDQPISDELRTSLTKLLRQTCFAGRPPEEVILNAKKANERCYGELSSKAEDLYFIIQGGNVSEKYRKFIDWKYTNLLDDRLLNYWATHRFTPNANMPVNVLQLNLVTPGKESRMSSSSNPSYSLREAIAQYVPGNSVVVDGVVYTVRGLECSNMYERVKTFQKIYRSKDRTVIATGESPLPDAMKWTVNDDYALELVCPVSFLPDVNEVTTRIVDQNIYTRVSAQLIGANDWDNVVSRHHLFSVRDNRESGDAKILYYNEGIGYGYAYCTRCGRTVMEHEVASSSEHPEIPPREMNPLTPRQPDKPCYHRAISGKSVGSICSSRSDYTSIRRNIIIGDLIQTDYSEIRIRHANSNHWISDRDAEYDLLITLGIVFTQALADALGKDRQSVDFALTPNGHICVFDTNPGGAGYANQLKKVELMESVINRSKIILEEASRKRSKDMLLDKFTLRYLRYIDIDEALSWIAEEEVFSM